MNTYVKFGILIAAILGALAWLAVGGITETKTYYKTVSELQKLGDQGKEKRLRVGGDIQANSIVREGKTVKFTLAQDSLRLNVVYAGIDPLPDTFKDGAQALAAWF
jgi:cytochrome c-type biogenesis protein CcmE